jgi:hypothetical protein
MALVSTTFTVDWAYNKSTATWDLLITAKGSPYAEILQQLFSAYHEFTAELNSEIGEGKDYTVIYKLKPKHHTEPRRIVDVESCRRR